jgi:hypothetical protein
VECSRLWRHGNGDAQRFLRLRLPPACAEAERQDVERLRMVRTDLQNPAALSLGLFESPGLLPGQRRVERPPQTGESLLVSKSAHLSTDIGRKGKRL